MILNDRAKHKELKRLPSSLHNILEKENGGTVRGSTTPTSEDGKMNNLEDYELRTRLLEHAFALT